MIGQSDLFGVTMSRNCREDLIAAAGRLFQQEGFQGTGIDRLLAEAGVAKMTLYRHFKSKDELVAVALERASVEHIAALESSLEGEGVERVLSLFQSLRAWCGVEGFSGCLLLNAVAEFKDPEHPVRVVVRRHAERTHDLVRRLVGETPANDPDRLADELMLLVEGSIELAAVHSCPSCTDTAKRAARTLIDAAC